MLRFKVCIIALVLFLMPTLLCNTVDLSTVPITAAKAAAAQGEVKVYKGDTKATDSKNRRAEVTAVRWSVQTDADTDLKKVRVVLDTTVAPKIKTSMVSSPVPRLVVDIDGIVPGNIVREYKLDGTAAESAVIAAIGGKSTRVTIDLPVLLESNDYKVFTLPVDAANKKTYRVVIDISEKMPMIKFNFTPGIKGKTLVIDPGHGGSDSGAVGLNGTMEKTVTLATAKKLQELLEKAGAKVLMTRTIDRDVFGPNASAVEELKARTVVANNVKADLFISIHADAFTNRQVGGTSTHYYPKTPYDAMFAKCVQEFLVSDLGLNDRGAKASNFYVIRRTYMPAILVEMAFISNPEEEKLLNTEAFTTKVAQGIYNGVDKFFVQASVSRIGGGK